MARVRIVLTNFEELSKHPAIEEAVRAASEVVASELRASDVVQRNEVEVRVGTHETDRHSGDVTLAHPSGLAIEAKHGALMRAATSSGLRPGKKKKGTPS
jgi:hypothetical protein